MNTLPAVIAVAMLGVCQIASAGASLVFNYPNGFANASNAITGAWSAHLTGSVIDLTDAGKEHEAGGAWYNTQQNITAFTTDFTFKITPSGAIPTIQGITFCVQNTNATANPISHGTNASSDANLAGYGTYNLDGQQPMINSVAVLFNLNSNSEQNYPLSGTPNATGLFINGGPFGALVPEQDLNPYGINFYSGDTFAVHIVYDGTILTMTLRDTVTNVQYRTSWPINIPAIMGGNLGWVGFTGGEIPSEPQDILTWDFYEGYNTRLATPTFSVAPGLYPSTQTVTLSAPAGATIYYTINGQQPTTSSTVYTGPITVSSSEVVEAVAVQSGYTDSTVAVANYQIAPTGTPLINITNFANASNLVTANGIATINGAALQLTSSSQPGGGNYGSAGSAWYDVPVNVQSFTTNFTLQFLNVQGNGMTFAIQNQPPAATDSSLLYVSGGPNAIGNYQAGLGYSGSTNGVGGQIAGLASSVAVKFDLSSGSGNSTGLYTDGADPSQNSVDITPSGVSLHSGHPLNVTLAYNGTTLALTITDTVTKASYAKSWTIDIPATVGGNTAYVGFTGGGGTATQDVLSWTYATSASQSAPAVPAAPTNLVVK
jgi:hypothetical protein